MELDHIVHFLNRNPDEAITALEQYGLKAVRGGSHRTWGTCNSLLYFGLTYIEYLAIENPEIASGCDNPLVRQLLMNSGQFEGFGQICFRIQDIYHLKESLLNKGFFTSDIIEGEREREDGITIRWKMLFILTESSLPYPFFIQWEQNDAKRLEELSEKGFLSQEQEKRTIKSISIVVKDPEKTAIDWSSLFTVPIKKQPDQLIIEIGQTEIVFRNPSSLELLNVLNSKGERPYLIEFKPSIKSEPFKLFGDIYS